MRIDQNAPPGRCPSISSIAVSGVSRCELDLILIQPVDCGRDKLENRCSVPTGQVMQFSMVLGSSGVHRTPTLEEISLLALRLRSRKSVTLRIAWLVPGPREFGRNHRKSSSAPE